MTNDTQDDGYHFRIPSKQVKIEENLLPWDPKARNSFVYREQTKFRRPSLPFQSFYARLFLIPLNHAANGTFTKESTDFTIQYPELDIVLWPLLNGSKKKGSAEIAGFLRKMFLLPDPRLYVFDEKLEKERAALRAPFEEFLQEWDRERDNGQTLSKEEYVAYKPDRDRSILIPLLNAEKLLPSKPKENNRYKEILASLQNPVVPGTRLYETALRIAEWYVMDRPDIEEAINDAGSASGAPLPKRPRRLPLFVEEYPDYVRAYSDFFQSAIDDKLDDDQRVLLEKVATDLFVLDEGSARKFVQFQERQAILKHAAFDYLRSQKKDLTSLSTYTDFFDPARLGQIVAAIEKKDPYPAPPFKDPRDAFVYAPTDSDLEKRFKDLERAKFEYNVRAGIEPDPAQQYELAGFQDDPPIDHIVESALEQRKNAILYDVQFDRPTNVQLKDGESLNYALILEDHFVFYRGLEQKDAKAVISRYVR